jgi:hypothetical protein
MLKYQDQFPWVTNIEELAGALASHVRELEDKRARVESGPNHPDLKANDLAAIDARLVPLRLKAQAAADGVFFYDPRDVSGGDRDHQTWVARARERGMLVNPSNFGASLHASEETEGSSLRVIRGGTGAHDLGSPAMSSR